MTNGSFRVGVASLLVAGVLAGVTACTGASHSATATASGPQFTGRLIVETLDGELDQVTFGADGTAVDKQIVAAPGTRVSGSSALVVAAAVSPDGTTLAYGAGKGLVLRNLKTGADTTLTPPDSTNVSCVSWAPDGRHLAVGTADALYLSDRAGHMTSLYTVTSQAYAAGPIGSQGAPGYVYSSFTCGTWLNPTDLVFQQSGPFPSSISYDSSGTLAADTTTVATLRTGAAPITHNEPTQWSVLASCGSLALIDSGINLYLVPGLSGEVTAAQATPSHARIADGTTSTALFRPGTCQPIVIEPPTTGTGNLDEVAEINPQTDRPGKSWQIPYVDITGSPSPGQDDFLWGPQNSDTLAYIGIMRLALVNLDSGATMDLSSALWTNAKLLVGWTD